MKPNKMNSNDFRKLRMKISRKFGKSLHLDYMDVIGLADGVAEGEYTKEKLFADLNEMVLDGSMEFV